MLDDRAILQNSLPPLGILSIGAYIEALDYKVKAYDVYGEKLDERLVRDRLQWGQPKFVGIPVLTNMSIPVHKIARICKEEVTDCTVVVGGVHAEATPDRMLSN